MLFCLDDLPEQAQTNGESAGSSATNRTAELEEELSQLRAQFAEYRATVEKTLDERWTDADKPDDAQIAREQKADAKYDQGYFDSYSYNGELALSTEHTVVASI